MREYYGYAFQSAVENDGVESIMTSYNRVNGVPSTVNMHMLDDLPRRTWGFDGNVVTDCDTLNDIVHNHPW